MFTTPTLTPPNSLGGLRGNAYIFLINLPFFSAIFCWVVLMTYPSVGVSFELTKLGFETTFCSS